MTAPLSMVLISGIGTLALSALFRYERSRSARYLGDVRAQFDHSIEDKKLRIQEWYRHITGQTMRQSVHYILHQMLTALLRMIHRMEAFVHSIVRFNKNRANRRKNSASTSHFSAIADHKRGTRLSDSQKQERRNEALMGH